MQKNPLYGDFEWEFDIIKLEREHPEERGRKWEAGQVVGGTDSQSEPELHLSAPNFSIPDALLGEFFCFFLLARAVHT